MSKKLKKYLMTFIYNGTTRSIVFLSYHRNGSEKNLKDAYHMFYEVHKLNVDYMSDPKIKLINY